MPINAYSLGLAQGTPAVNGAGYPLAGARERMPNPCQARAHPSNPREARKALCAAKARPFPSRPPFVAPAQLWVMLWRV
jgi:hypothetical protein